MSLTANTQAPGEFKFGYSPQVAFGTVIADSGAFTEVDCEPIVVNRDIKQIEVVGSHGSREVHENNIVVVGKESLPSFTTDMIVKKEELADLLAAFFQNVVEGESTPFDKTFTMLSSQPDFLADAGYWYTWIVWDPVASRSVAVKDCIMKSLTFTLPNDGPAKISAEWIGLGQPNVNSNPSGTWTPNAPSNLFWRGDIDRASIDFGSGATSFHLSEFELALSREIMGVGQDGSGQFRFYHLAKPNHTFKMKIVKDTDFDDVLSNQLAGTAIDINVSWGNVSPGTDDGDLDIAAHAIIDGPAGAEYEYDDPMTGMVSGKLARSETDEICTVVMADDVDKSW